MVSLFTIPLLVILGLLAASGETRPVQQDTPLLDLLVLPKRSPADLPTPVIVHGVSHPSTLPNINRRWDSQPKLFSKRTPAVDDKDTTPDLFQPHPSILPNHMERSLLFEREAYKGYIANASPLPPLPTTTL